MKYSIVIPCFNEEKSINSLIDSCVHLLSKKNIDVIENEKLKLNKNNKNLNILNNY